MYSKTEGILGSTSYAMSVQATRRKLFLQKTTKPYKLLLSELESTFREIWLWHVRAMRNHKDILYTLLLCFQCAVVGYNLT